jgi:hypothetical protein
VTPGLESSSFIPPITVNNRRFSARFLDFFARKIGSNEVFSQVENILLLFHHIRACASQPNP